MRQVLEQARDLAELEQEDNTKEYKRLLDNSDLVFEKARQLML